MWNIHWNIRGTLAREAWGLYEVENIQFDQQFLTNYFKYFVMFYFAWAAVYYFVILFLCWNTILKNDYYCLLLNEIFRGDIIKDVRLKYGKNVAKVAFMVKHFIYILLMVIQTLPGFFSEYYAVFQVVFYTFLLFKRGGDYYIDHFSRKYEYNLKMLDKLGKKYDPLKMRPDTKIVLD